MAALCAQAAEAREAELLKKHRELEDELRARAQHLERDAGSALRAERAAEEAGRARAAAQARGEERSSDGTIEGVEGWNGTKEQGTCIVVFMDSLPTILAVYLYLYILCT